MDKYQTRFQYFFDAIARKQATIEQKAEEKKNYLDPKWKFKVADALIQDADTVQTVQKEWLRFQGWDSYETNPKTYLERPTKFDVHRRSYAQAYGLDPNDVTMNDLLEAGKAQKQAFRQKLLEAADPEGNISYKRRGTDQEAGRRILAEVLPEGKQAAFLQDVTSRFEDAGYSGKFNILRELQDFESGDALDHSIGSSNRTVLQATTDSVANFVRGGLNMINDTAQAVSVLTGASQFQPVDTFFEKNRERLEAFKQFFNSPQQLRSERLANEKRTRITEPLFQVRMQEYMSPASGSNSEGEAKFKASLDEAGDTVADLIRSPGRVLDGFFESLPYMLGVGAVGKTALNIAAKNIQKGVAKELAAAGSANVDDLAKFVTKSYIQTKQGTNYMKRVGELTGVATVGLTEGLTNAAATYSSILNMSEEEAQQSAKYKGLRTQFSHEEAVKKLAQDGFIETFGLMTLIAGAASKVTGAAGFESRMFSRLADGRKAVSKTIAAQGLAKKAIAVGEGVQKVLVPGIRETVEESIQSGTGEFLTQLAQFEASGKPIGSGVGAATAEGGVLGFVSGAGVSGASIAGKAALQGGAKAVLSVSNKNKTLDEATTGNPEVLFQAPPAPTAAPEGSEAPPAPPQPFNPQNPVDDGTQAGGSTILAHNKVKEEQAAGTYDPVVSYKTAFENYQASAEDPAKPEQMVKYFNELEVHYNQQIHTGTSLSKEEQTHFDAVKDNYITHVNNFANLYLSNLNITEYTPQQKSVINEAAFRKLGAVTDADEASLTPQARTVLNNVKNVNATLDTMIQESAKATIIQAEAQSRDPTAVPQEEIDELTRVNAEKLEDLVSVIPSKKGGHNKTVLGLKAHVREMLELSSRGDEGSKQEFKNRQGVVSNFARHQTVQLDNLHTLLTAVTSNATPEEQARIEKETGFYYQNSIPYGRNPAVQLYQYKQAEIQRTKQVQMEMAQVYQAWNGNTDPAIREMANAPLVTPGSPLPVQQKAVPEPIPAKTYAQPISKMNGNQVVAELKQHEIQPTSVKEGRNILQEIRIAENESPQALQSVLDKYKAPVEEAPKVTRAFQNADSPRKSTFRAYERSDGTWLVQTRPNAAAQWNTEPARTELDTRGLKPIPASGRTGTTRIAGETFQLAEPISAEEQALLKDDTSIPTLHRELLDDTPGIDVQGLLNQGINMDSADIKAINTKAFGSVFRKDSAGMNYEDTENWLVRKGYLPEVDTKGKPEQNRKNEVAEVIGRLLSGEDIYSTRPEITEAVSARDAEAHYQADEDQRAAQEEQETEGEEQPVTAATRITPVAKGKVRLYRAGNKSDVPSTVADWIKQSEAYKNTLAATGRWFTHDLSIAKDYIKNEYPDGQLTYIDVTPEQAAAFNVQNIPTKEGGKATVDNPKAYSIDPETEYYVDPATAQTAQVLIESTEIPGVTAKTKYREMINLRDGTDVQAIESQGPSLDTNLIREDIIRAQLPEMTYSQLQTFINRKQSKVNNYTGTARSNIISEIADAQAKAAEFPESARVAIEPKVRDTVDITAAIDRGDVGSHFRPITDAPKTKRYGTPPTVTVGGQELPTTGIKGENIASTSRGGSVLGSQLTNKTYSALQITDVPGLKKPTGQDVDQMSAEAWYKANKATTGTPAEKLAQDKATMQTIVETKLQQHPELVQEITTKGGRAWIEASEHTVGVRGSRWEGKGVDSNFINVLANAYDAVTKNTPVVSNPVNKPIKITKIISGGQFGSDTGGLVAAAELKIPTGGTMPPDFARTGGFGRKLAERYGLTEGESDSRIYPKRTMKNVDDADVTIAFRYQDSPGTDKTIGYAQTGEWKRGKSVTTLKGHRPIIVVTERELTKAAQQIVDGLRALNKDNVTLNIAGHRKVDDLPDIGVFTKKVIVTAINILTNEDQGLPSQQVSAVSPIVAPIVEPIVTPAAVEPDLRPERLLAIKELRQSVTNTTPTENLVLPTADNEQLQTLLEQGFTADQALAQIESSITQNVANERVEVKEHPKYPKIVKQASTTIESINRGEASPVNTQDTLDQLIDMEIIADNLSLVVPPEAQQPDVEPGRVPQLKAAFKKLKLAFSGKQAFTVRNPQSKSLFNTAHAVVYAMTTDPITRKQIYEKLDVTNEQAEGFDAYLNYYQEFSKAFDKIYTRFDSKDPNSIIAKSGKFAQEKLKEYVAQYLFNNQGRPSVDLLAAMAMESMNWLATSGPASIINRDDTIKRILSVPFGMDLTAAQRNRFQHIGTSRLETALRLGEAVWRHTNLKTVKDDDIDHLLEDRMVASLGSMMLGVMHEMGNIVGESMSIQELAEYRHNQTRDKNDERQAVFIKNAPPSNAEEDLGKNSKENIKLKEAHEKVRKVFAKYFNSTPYNKGPVFEKPTKVTSEIARGSMQAPQNLLDRVLKMSQHAIRISPTLMTELVDRYGTGDDYLFDIEGRHTEEEIEQRTHTINRRGKRAQNLADKRTFDALRNFWNQYGDKEFYLENKIIATGRIYVDSDTINYQDNKIQRFLLQMPEWANEISDVNSQEYYLFMTAIGLGFDIDPSLYKQTEIVKRVQEIAGKSEIQKAIEILQNPSTEKFSDAERAAIKAAVEILGVATHSLVALKEYASYLTAKEKGLPFTSYLPTEVDGKSNGLAALFLQFVPLNDAERAFSKKMLNSTGAAFEGDEFRNNPEFVAQGGKDIYQNFSMAVGSNLGEMAKGNVPAIDKESYYSAETNDKARRAYIRQHGTVAVTSANLLPSIRQMNLLDTAEGESGGKKGRKWAKPTVIRVGYNAQIRSIKAGQVADALETYYEQLSLIGWNKETGKSLGLTKEQHAEAIATHMQKIFNIINVVREANAAANFQTGKSKEGTLATAPTKKLHITAKRILEIAKEQYNGNLNELQSSHVLDNAFVQEFAVALEETYGHATQAALETMLGPIAKIQAAMAQATQWMNIAFTKDFRRRLAWFQKSHGGIVASKQQRRDILNQMIREGRVPSITTALSKDVMERLDISKYGQVTLAGARGIAYFNQEVQTSQNKARSIATSLKGLDPDPDIGVSAIVKAIHNTDGAVNSSVFGQFPAFNIHDAIITGTKFTLDAAKKGNNTFANLHASYSIAQAIWDSFIQMNFLASGANTQLSTQDRKEIQQEFYDNMVKHADWPRNADTKQIQNLIDNWITTTQQIVDDNNKARTILFGELRFMGQFAIDQGQAEFPEGIGNVDPQKINVTTKVTSQRELIQKLHKPAAYRELIRDVSKAITAKTDPSKLILDILTAAGQQLDANEVFNALVAAYELAGSPIAQTLREINSILGDNIKGVKLRVRKLDEDLVNAGISARFDAVNRGIITLERSLDNRNVMQDIAHEMLHAMNYRKLKAMQKAQPAQFQKLLTIAQDFLRKLNPKNPTHRAIFRAVMFHHKRDPAGFISEYLSHVLTTPAKLGAEYKHFFADSQILIAIQTLNKALADERGRTPYKSTPGVLDKNDFGQQTAELLESDKLQMIFEEMDKLHGAPTNPSENAFLDEVIENTLVPGMRSIEAVMLHRTIVPTATSNEGEFVEPTIVNGTYIPGTIYVAAAGNPTSATMSMSAKEVGVHEVLHAMTHAALNATLEGSWLLRQEARRLFEIAKAQVRPEHFLEDAGAATLNDWAAAEVRWNHIFNNPHSQGYHEFLAMGRSNYQFAVALSRIDNKQTKVPIWTGEFMSSLTNLVQRIVDWISLHTTRRNEPTVDKALIALVDDIIKINKQNIAAVGQLREASFVNKWNDKTVRGIADKLLKKLNDPAAQEALRVAGERGERTDAITQLKAYASIAVSGNTEGFRTNLNKAFRDMQGKKDNAFFQILEEVLPYQQANIKFYDLLRKSKVAIDMKRQQLTEHTRSFLLNKFDSKYFRTQAQRNAITQTFLMTDLSALTQGKGSIDEAEVIRFVADTTLAADYRDKLIADLKAQLSEQLSESDVKLLMERFVDVQGTGLAEVMADGIAPARHQMLNTHNIVHQFNITDEALRKEVPNKKEVIETLDKIISLKALLRTDPAILAEAQIVIERELARDSSNENALAAFIGLSEDFKAQSKIVSFADNPIQMRKGHIAELYDEDMEIEVVPTTEGNEVRMRAEGYTFAKNMGRDKNDPNQRQMSMWARRSTVTAYQKTILSLRDIHHGGVDMFTSLEQGLQNPNSDGRISAYQAAVNFAQAHRELSRLAANETELPVEPRTNLVPILDDIGVIRGYRYMMSERDRRVILKKRSYFDEVLPHMFSSMLDKMNSKEINRMLVKALYEDWREHGEYLNHPKNPEHRFLEVSKHSSNPKAREMYRLLPKDTQEHMRAFFKGDQFYIRDDVVNLVMGFRKLSFANNKFLGKAAPLVQLGEKIFQELIQWKRIKVAILNPMVVVGNIVSNTALLLIEGIPPSYIMKMGSEALQGIKNYQRDIRRADELEHEIHAFRKLGHDVTVRANQLAQLQDDIRRNPVGELIDEGLFTSIVQEFGIDENSWRRQTIARFTEKLGDKTPVKLMKAGKEIWMMPGSKSFQAALTGTQYGDFVARYIKYKYDTEVINQAVDPETRKGKAINDALASFIYYDLPQNEYLQYANDMGFVMFTKFFARIQPVIARMFLKNPASATIYAGLQASFLEAPWDENIANFGAFSGISNKGTLTPWEHIWNTDYIMPSSLQWLKMFGIG